MLVQVVEPVVVSGVVGVWVVVVGSVVVVASMVVVSAVVVVAACVVVASEVVVATASPEVKTPNELGKQVENIKGLSFTAA
jgi:hypothetical protein